ncbi:MAG: DUF4349 domain-containing protein [Syntrophomonadaceae bacterium]|jgi:hypothetical protein
MNCKKAKSHFSLLLDNDLDQTSSHALMRHLSQCPDCAREWQEFKHISLALKEIGRDVLSAPESFSSEVMGRIRMDSKVKRTGALRRWKTALAGVAAAVLLVFGSLSVMPGLLDAPEVNIAQDPGSKDALPPGNSAVIPDPADDPDPDTSGKVQPPDTADPDLLDILKTAKDPGTTPTQPSNHEEPVNIAEEPFMEVPAPVLLDKERTILTIGVKMDFADPDAAMVRVREGAAAAGGFFESLGQKGEGGDNVYKIVIPASSYEDYLNSVCSLGTVVTQQEEKEDITSHYSELLQQYGVLCEHLQTAEDEHEKLDLEGQKRALEQQLYTWDKESNQVTILLWS